MDNIDYKVKVGFVPAGDGGRVTIVLSFASESPSLLGAEACGAKNALVKDVPAKSGAEAFDESIIKKDLAAAEAPAAGAVDSAKAKATAVGIPPESEPSPLKDGIDAGGGNVAGESSPMKSFAKVGIVPADDGRITIVISESVSPSLLGAKACGVKNVKDISVAKCGTEDVLKKDPAAEKAPDAGAVDSDKAKAMFAAHVPRSTAVFWSKYPRPTAPTGAVKGALKKDIPAAESGAEASVDETGAIKNPALKPATKVATALKPAAVCGETLPSIKKFPEPAPAGDDGWTVSAKEFPKEKLPPAGEPDWIVSNSRNKTERKGEVKSTKVSNKYDLLDDVETNVEAEIDEDEDEKKKEKGKEKEAEKESSFESVSPESVGGNGKAAVDETEPTSTLSGFRFGKFCSTKLLCVFLTVVVGLGCSAFALSSYGSAGVSELLESVFVPDAAAIPAAIPVSNRTGALATVFGSPGPIPSIGEDAHVARELQGVGTRIVGGVPTGVQEFEWLVNLRDTRFGQQGFCGGTLMSANWVLTAAHCVINYKKANKRKKLRVAIGRHKTNGNSHPNNKHPIQQLSVEAVHMHQSYNESTLKNDIALLKLSSPAMDYWEAVDSLGMPAADIGGEKLTVAGWGTLSFGGNTPSVAQKVEVEGSNCSAYGNWIKDGMICAAESGKDSCQGDSGGPLVYKNGADDFTLVGVVSWGEGCAGSKPGVYTDVDYFRSWICETMEENTGSGDDPLHQSCGDSTPPPSPSPSPPPTQIQLPPVAEFEGVFLSSTDQKWYAVAAGSKSSGFTTASSALLWLPSLCADSHDRCPMKLNTAAKRAKNCPKANGWNSQKCAATCGPELGGCSPG